MIEYKRWEVIIKERNNPYPLKTSMWGCYNEEDVIKFFGLRNRDVEWFKIREEQKVTN